MQLLVRPNQYVAIWRQGIGKRYIYVLRDPRTDRVRYVGCSANPAARFGAHWSKARCLRRGDLEATTPLLRWLAELGNIGPPSMEVLCEGDTDVESAKIATYDTPENDLVNTSQRRRRI